MTLSCVGEELKQIVFAFDDVTVSWMPLIWTEMWCAAHKLIFCAVPRRENCWVISAFFFNFNWILFNEILRRKLAAFRRKNIFTLFDKNSRKTTSALLSSPEHSNFLIFPSFASVRGLTRVENSKFPQPVEGKRCSKSDEGVGGAEIRRKLEIPVT